LSRITKLISIYIPAKEDVDDVVETTKEKTWNNSEQLCSIISRMLSVLTSFSLDKENLNFHFEEFFSRELDTNKAKSTFHRESSHE
jgi:hypothetical protein